MTTTTNRIQTGTQLNSQTPTQQTQSTPLLTHKHIQLPWDLHKNSETSAVAEEVMKECLGLGLLDNEEQKKILRGVIELGGHFYPQSTKSGLYFGTMLVVWLYFFDDIFDEENDPQPIEIYAELVRRTSHVMQYGSLPTTQGSTQINAKNSTTSRHQSQLVISPDIMTPVEKLALRVRQMACSFANGRSELLGRFFEDCRVYCEEGILPMEELRISQKLPTLEEYLPLRVLNGAGDIIVSGHELVSHTVISKDIIYEPRITRMREIASLVIDFSNDIYSYNREVGSYQKNINAVYIRAKKLQTTQNLSASSSLAMAIHDQVCEINLWVSEYKLLKSSLQKSLLLRNGGDLHVYCIGLENAMTGAKIWSESTERYGLGPNAKL